LEITQAIVDAASELRAPVIVQTSPSAIRYAGLEELACIIRNMGSKTKIPVALHLDHGKDIKLIKECLRNGYTSVMIDGSFLPFKKNVELTKKAVKIAHAKRVPVEAELGQLQGVEDGVSAKKHIYTDPDEAKKFVKLTNIDSLTVAIGTSHGAYKFNGKSRIDLERLKQIREKVSVPLVLHGASSVPEEIIKIAKKYGAKLEGAKGVAEKDIKKAIKLGVCKVNIDTDLRLAFTAAVRKELFEKPSTFSPREIIGVPRTAVKAAVKQKIRLLGSEGKA
jgi:fructose-bisphosphate aldolase class II